MRKFVFIVFLLVSCASSVEAQPLVFECFKDTTFNTTLCRNCRSYVSEAFTGTGIKINRQGDSVYYLVLAPITLHQSRDSVNFYMRGAQESGYTFRLANTNQFSNRQQIEDFISQCNVGGHDTDKQYIDSLSIVNDSLVISLIRDGMAPLKIDLSPFLDNTDDQKIDTFFIQGNTLYNSNENDGEAAKTVDLSPYLDDTDDQFLDTFLYAPGTFYDTIFASIVDDGVPASWVKIPHMHGATTLNDGQGGLVPAPLAGDDTKFLTGAATYAFESGRKRVIQSAHGFTIPAHGFRPISSEGGSWVNAATDNEASLPEAYMIKWCSADSFEILFSGWLYYPGHGLTVGSTYFLQDNGTLSTTPDGDGDDPDYYVPLAHVETADWIILYPLPGNSPGISYGQEDESDIYYGQTGTTLLVAGLPAVPLNLQVYRNGVKVYENEDWTRVANLFTFNMALKAAERIEVRYKN